MYISSYQLLWDAQSTVLHNRGTIFLGYCWMNRNTRQPNSILNKIKPAVSQDLTGSQSSEYTASQVTCICLDESFLWLTHANLTFKLSCDTFSEALYPFLFVCQSFWRSNGHLKSVLNFSDQFIIPNSLHGHGGVMLPFMSHNDDTMTLNLVSALLPHCKGT